jgi:hypothetical protein
MTCDLCEWRKGWSMSLSPAAWTSPSPCPPTSPFLRGAGEFLPNTLNGKSLEASRAGVRQG